MIDYTPYLCPWTREDLDRAKADGKLHYFFMAGEGIHISLAQMNVDKWGDSCLILLPNGQTMLIDCAPEAYGPVLRRNLQQMGISHLDYILVTHPHNDHQNGVFADSNLPDGLLAHITVGQVLCKDTLQGTTTDDRMVPDVCAARNIPLRILTRGDVLRFGDVTMQVLWPMPNQGDLPLIIADVNNQSIVMRLDFCKHSALFAGDLYVAGEGYVLENTDPELLKADLLKIPHHGHGTSGSEAFLAAVSPKLSVAMARVPMKPAVRQRYADAGSQLLYDLIHGYIHVTADSSGKLTYTTTRNNSPDEQLNTPSASLLPPETTADK